jgi:urease gamma subunit
VHVQPDALCKNSNKRFGSLRGKQIPGSNLGALTVKAISERMTMNTQYKILVIWNDSTMEYLKDGRKVAMFSSRQRAEAQRDFMLEGMSDEVQSINVVLDQDPV